MSMMQSVVVRKNSEVVIETKVPSEMEDLIEEAEDKAKGQVIHLYDGPPDYLPEGARMVCFTSPNKEWFNQNEKDQYHSTLFMPLWSLHELQTTVTELGLEMDPRFDLHVRTESEEETLFEKLVEQRFYVFGGVARECLSTRANLSKTVKRESRIFWMKPSGYVKRWLVEHLTELIRKKRNETISCLEETPPAASYHGSLFETGVHEKRGRG
ncbi:hypothetical protein GQ600_18492 [Phytophthora cactorum]|nr:hypothetical protein GQ600_18492 [Phytophthora cactorum]